MARLTQHHICTNKDNEGEPYILAIDGPYRGQEIPIMYTANNKIQTEIRLPAQLPSKNIRCMVRTNMENRRMEMPQFIEYYLVYFQPSFEKRKILLDLNLPSDIPFYCQEFKDDMSFEIEQVLRKIGYIGYASQLSRKIQ